MVAQHHSIVITDDLKWDSAQCSVSVYAKSDNNYAILNPTVPCGVILHYIAQCNYCR